MTFSSETLRTLKRGFVLVFHRMVQHLERVPRQLRRMIWATFGGTSSLLRRRILPPRTQQSLRLRHPPKHRHEHPRIFRLSAWLQAPVQVPSRPMLLLAPRASIPLRVQVEAHLVNPRPIQVLHPLGLQVPHRALCPVEVQVSLRVRRRNPR